MIKSFLIWKERSDRNYFIRQFPNLEELNDFLTALNPDNVVEVKVIQGAMIDERFNNVG